MDDVVDHSVYVSNAVKGGARPNAVSECCTRPPAAAGSCRPANAPIAVASGCNSFYQRAHDCRPRANALARLRSAQTEHSAFCCVQPEPSSSEEDSSSDEEPAQPVKASKPAGKKVSLLLCHHACAAPQPPWIAQFGNAFNMHALSRGSTTLAPRQICDTEHVHERRGMLRYSHCCCTPWQAAAPPPAADSSDSSEEEDSSDEVRAAKSSLTARPKACSPMFCIAMLPSAEAVAAAWWDPGTRCLPFVTHCCLVTAGGSSPGSQEGSAREEGCPGSQAGGGGGRQLLGGGFFR